MQLLTAEERYRMSCKRYRDDYINALEYLNKFCYPVIECLPNGFVTVREFREEFPFQVVKERVREVSFEVAMSLISKLVRNLGFERAEVYLHVEGSRVLSITIEEISD